MVEEQSISFVDEGLGNSAYLLDLGDSREAEGRGLSIAFAEDGERAMTGATLLRRNGSRAMSGLDGGAGDWAEATSQALEHGA